MSSESSATPVVAASGADAEERSGSTGRVLDALGDQDCRDILRAMGEEALTASECSTACDLPLSTTYRKLERLSEAGLVTEGLRIRRDGKHASQYRRRFTDVSVGLSPDGEFEVALTPRVE